MDLYKNQIESQNAFNYLKFLQKLIGKESATNEMCKYMK